MYAAAVSMIHSELPLGLLGGVPPGRDPVAAEDAAHRLRVGLLDRGDVEAELEAGAPPGHPDHLVAEDLRGELLPVRGGRDRDAGVGVQVVDVGRVDEPVHGGVDRRGRAALAVQAVVERGDHLVLALDTRVDVHQRPHPVQAQGREPGLGQGAQVTAGPLDPDQLDLLAGDGVDVGALGGGVSPGVVGVLLVGAEPVGSLDQLGHGLVGHDVLLDGARWGWGECSGPAQVQDACAPPTRSSSICCW